MNNDPNQIVLSEFETEYYKFVADPPIVLDIKHRKSGVYVARDCDLSIHVFHELHGEIYNELIAEIEFLWENYVLVPESELAPDAIRLRNKINTRIKGRHVNPTVQMTLFV